MALGQILPISFVQNLFYLSILLFRPLSQGTLDADKNRDGRATDLLSLQIIAVGVYYLDLFVAPQASGKSVLMPAVLLLRLVLFSPYVLYLCCPRAFGARYKRVSRGTQVLFAVLAVIKQTYVALQDVAKFRSSQVVRNWAFNGDVSGGIQMTQVLLGRINSHPAVQALGWDVVLVLSSCAVWVASKGARTQTPVKQE